MLYLRSNITQNVQ